MLNFSIFIVSLLLLNFIMLIGEFYVFEKYVFLIVGLTDSDYKIIKCYFDI